MDRRVWASVRARRGPARCCHRPVAVHWHDPGQPPADGEPPPGLRAADRQALGETAFQAAYHRGLDLPAEDVLACALQQPPEKPQEKPLARAVSEAAPLTPRELQVARLIAEGRSNREIAAELVISQRTAENHVEHILTKLGFTSRAQVAVWAAASQADSAVA